MNNKKIIDLFLSAGAGFLIWGLSQSITGHKEPWDAKGFYYPVALLIAGLFLGVVRKPNPSTFYIGIYAGQLLYALISIGGSPFIVLGLLFLAFYSAISIVGFFVGYLINEYYQYREK